MIRNKIFATYTFRFMISYVTSLSLGAFVLLMATYVFYSYDYFTGINTALENELDLLEHEYLNRGVEGLDTLSQQRNANSKYDRFSYILIDDDGKKVSGDITQWPAYKRWSAGWLSFEMIFEDWTGEPQLYNFLARKRHLDQGHELMVARVADDVRQNIKLVGGTLLWGMFIMIILGIIGGIITSLISLQRIETINQSIRSIMEGDLSERIPVQEPIDDFQKLAINLNDMLDKIEDAVDDVRQVTSNIAHDLRTPLTRLRNKLSMLEERAAPQNLEIVRSLLLESDSLLSTFGALLRISQVESGNKKANFMHVCLSEILDDVIELYEPLAANKDVDLSGQKMPNIMVLGDRDLLFQMLANLMDNAIKYTPEHGSICTELSVKDQNVSIIFADNGPGIPKEKHDKVFQRFYRVEESRGIHPGNGLGLSLVQAVAKLHGGDIRLDDSVAFYPSSPSPGLKVDVLLPVA